MLVGKVLESIELWKFDKIICLLINKLEIIVICWIYRVGIFKFFYIEVVE